MRVTVNLFSSNSRGILKIAEVASRFDDVRGFLTTLSHLGFKMMIKVSQNKINQAKHENQNMLIFGGKRDLFSNSFLFRL